MIEESYAHEYTYDTPYLSYQETFKRPRKGLRKRKRASGESLYTCQGDTSKPLKAAPMPKLETSFLTKINYHV